VKHALDELALLRITQEDQEKKLKAESADLAKQQAELEKSVGERKAHWRETSKAHKEAAARAAKLARRSANLQDLVGGLGAADKNRDSVKESLFGWFAKSGDEMPVVGVVETGYGEKIEGGGASQGLRIRANAGAVVVSPSNGTVKFAGPFRQYKLLVIVQHESGDHSLLGGLNELYTRVGERVTSGEPIGKLSGDSTRTASLYYERRHRGKAVDPRRAKN
jgi:septal ring factor EnvC (AmiA/AmiB activator)